VKLSYKNFKIILKGGAWEIESSEFGSTVLAMVGPAVSQDAENFSGVVLLLQKLLCCFGSGCWTRFYPLLHKLLLPLVAGQVDGVFKVLYNAAIGGYIK
jgi:hypothetical protein